MCQRRSESRLTRIPFAVKFRGRPIRRCKVPLSGIQHNVTLDWELAIQWWNIYTREEFADLDVDDQARMIAVYRLKHHIDAVIAKDQADEMKRS